MAFDRRKHPLWVGMKAADYNATKTELLAHDLRMFMR